jgi:hypothetical protein
MLVDTVFNSKSGVADEVTAKDIVSPGLQVVFAMTIVIFCAVVFGVTVGCAVLVARVALMLPACTIEAVS